MKIEQEVVTTTWIRDFEVPAGTFLENNLTLAGTLRFTPTQVVIKVSPQGRNSESGGRVTVRVQGRVINKDGSLSKKGTMCEYSNSNAMWGRVPLTEMPGWLRDLCHPYVFGGE